MKIAKIVFWISTGLLSAMMLMSAGMYFFKHADMVQAFETLGFPNFVIYPLAIFKLLGIVAILTRAVEWLKEWAYAGFFFNFLLAFGAHFMAEDGEAGGAVVALVLLLVSYTAQKKAFV